MNLETIRDEFGPFVVTQLSPLLEELATVGLIEWEGDEVLLTRRGRLVSNEIFERFLTDGAVVGAENSGRVTGGHDG